MEDVEDGTLDALVVIGLGMLNALGVKSRGEGESIKESMTRSIVFNATGSLTVQTWQSVLCCKSFGSLNFKIV